MALWQGPYKDRFVGMYDAEGAQSTSTEAALRAEAAQWANFWTTETNARIERLHNDRVRAYNSDYTFDEDGNSVAPSRPRPTRPPDQGVPGPPAYFPSGGGF